MTKQEYVWMIQTLLSSWSDGYAPEDEARPDLWQASFEEYVWSSTTFGSAVDKEPMP